MRYARITLLVFALCLLIPTAVFAQDPLPTKTPAGGAPPPTAAGPTPVPEGSSLQLRVDLRPQLGMELFSATYAPVFFDEQNTGGGDKYIAIGGDCIDGYTSTASSLGIYWVADSGPVVLSFTPDSSAQTASFLIWDMEGQEWWCNTDFFDVPTYTFDNMSQGVYFVWLLAPEPTLVAGTLEVIQAE